MVEPQVLEADLRLLDASLLTLGALHLHTGTRQALHTHLCSPCLLGHEASGVGVGGWTSTLPLESLHKRGFLTSKNWPHRTAAGSRELLFEAKGPCRQWRGC